jgi:hypothetical protein
MPNIGRNQPCPCGSGKKYKRCHGAWPVDNAPWLPPEIEFGLDQKIRETQAIRLRREKQQGLGRPIVSTKMNGNQIVVVGARMLTSTRWKTFHDFLQDLFFTLLGQDWVEAERAKPLECQHTILRWFVQAIEAQRIGPKHGDILVTPMTGAIQAFINLAYNIYLIAHHSENGIDGVVRGYIARLKSSRPDDFCGALFETYAAAGFLKAGFKLTFENEQDSSVSHVEFVAEYPKTGKKFSVEVKARERSRTASVEGDVDEVKRLRVANKLNKALGKRADHTRVVMIEINIPDLPTSYAGWPASALKLIDDNAKTEFASGERKPNAYVFVTDHAFHNNLSQINVGLQVLATGFRIPDFGPHARHASYKEALEARKRHCEMFSLLHSLRTHYEIPSTFEGEMPEFAFMNTDGRAPLKFGNWYLVPTAEGSEVPGRLVDAAVIEHSKSVMGCYQLQNGIHVMASCPISDAELEAYRKYPETFFGEVRDGPNNPKTLVEWCDFFYETYKNTSRDKALEWLAGSPDLAELQKLSQEDLAFILCERWGLHAFNRAQKPAA